MGENMCVPVMPKLYTIGNGPPFAPSPQAMWPGGMFKPGWHIGAYFRCIIRRGLHHRVYEGPPDGTPRVRLGPEEITVDFTKTYRIRALFCNTTYSAVQFKVPETLSGVQRPSMMVWINVRRRNDWWADLVHASLGKPVPADDDGRIGESIVVTPSRRSISSPRFAPTVPAWNEINHGDSSS